LETTALGAAWLVGYEAGFWCENDPIAADAGATTRFEPHWDAETRKRRIDGWHDAVRRTRVQQR
ncbi:MAG: glycerol kinase, partial [Alphaproteobacteria bacterium]|nr:glycerol kinase [Alphaproteobacteria bacterium]